MGNCFDNNPETTEDRKLNNELSAAQQRDIYIKKLLFLGAGGSGKSTIFKQLRKIHGDGWGQDYLTSFMQYIHVQIIEQMKLSIECVSMLAEQELMDQNGDDYQITDDFNPYCTLSSKEAQKAAFTMKSLRLTTLNEETANACKILWNEAVIKDIYEQRAIMKIEDTSAYFWDKIDEIMTKGYVPNETDILLVRLRSTGVQEQKFKIKNVTFHIFDVGGQKSERKKWIHCFENVTAMIFVVSLSCYDEVMFEDEKMNSMVDSLQLFKNICNNEWFKNTSIILFLNKKDLFADKLAENRPITLCSEFEDYKGDETSFEESSEYIKSKFRSMGTGQNDSKTIYSHLTCATDKDNVKKVFIDVQAIVIEGALRAQAMLGDGF